MAQKHRVHVWLKVFAVRMPYLSISPSPFSCIRHPCCSRAVTSFPSAPSLPHCSRSESAGQAHFCACGEEFGYLADPKHSTPWTYSFAVACSSVECAETKGSAQGEALPKLRLGSYPGCAAWLRREPKCAGAAMSRALLNPVPDWPALRVACVGGVLRETWEEPFERPLPDLFTTSAALCSSRTAWPRTRRMWLTRLTPKLSRGRTLSAGPGRAERARAWLG